MGRVSGWGWSDNGYGTGVVNVATPDRISQQVGTVNVVPR